MLTIDLFFKSPFSTRQNDKTLHLPYDYLIMYYTTAVNFDNWFNEAMNELVNTNDYYSSGAIHSIEIINKEIDGKKLKIKNLSKEFSKNYFLDDIEISDSDFSLEIQIDHLEQKVASLEEQKLSLAEMRIIYLYKSTEIKIKKILKEAYNYSIKIEHNNLRNFLKGKEIILSEILCSKEFDELKKVNNCLKHSGEIDEVKEIKEFKQKILFKYEDLIAFYKRVYNKVQKFIEDMIAKIRTDLFEFDAERLKQLASDYCKKMNEETIKKFAKILISQKNGYNKMKNDETEI